MDEIRLSIFLITSVCVGAPVLIWALHVLSQLRKRGAFISTFTILLLLSALLELLLNSYMVPALLSGEKCCRESIMCRMIILTWSGLKAGGLHLHQLLALEGVFSLRHPHCSTHVFSSPTFIVFSIITCLCVAISQSFSISLFLVLSVFSMLSVLVITCVVICRTPPYRVQCSHTCRGHYEVLAVCMFSLIMYLPLVCMFVLFASLKFFQPLSIFCCTPGSHQINGLFTMALCLISLRVISDPLLCVLVCKNKFNKQRVQAKDHIRIPPYKNTLQS